MTTGPALTGDGQYAYALQSKRNETQSADSFARMLWPFGGSFLDENFRSNLLSAESQAGLQFRQDLMQFMPEGIVAYDHSETVNALAQGDVAMITEWSAFYSTLASEETSTLGECLAIAPEPHGPGLVVNLLLVASRSPLQARPMMTSRLLVICSSSG